MYKRQQYRVWWYGESITSELSREDVEELKRTAAPNGFQEIDAIGGTKILVCEDWMVWITKSKKSA